MKPLNNPLVEKFPNAHNAIAFDLIKEEHFLPALDWAITVARQRIATIKADRAEANFENTILALETSGEEMELVSRIYHNLLGAEKTDKLQGLVTEIGPRLSNHASDVLLDQQLFSRVKAVFDKQERLALSQEQKQLLENTYTSFVRNGALLDEGKKERLRKIDEELSKLGPTFSDQVLQANNAFQYFITDEKHLAGLPPSAVEAAALEAKAKGHDGEWLFTLDAPSYLALMKFADHRPSREKMWRAYNSRSFNDKFDNRQNIMSIVRLRDERAHLLGYENHAHFVLEKRMAESPERVFQFINQMMKVVKPAAEQDLKDVQQLAHELDGPKELMPWDFTYYTEKLKQKRFDYNEEDLRPYFKLENVIDGVFEHAKKLFFLDFKPSTQYPTYHPDVKVYEVYRQATGEFMGLFYADFFPRPSKRGGAWMTNFYEQGLFQGRVIRPHVSIVCNFTKPMPDKPSLLTFMEVQTLFHEFGHSLHSLLSQCQYQSLAGTNVYWDFVELPSQFLENWTFEKESLDLFARHYQTGEKIPAELTQKIKDSSNFFAGSAALRQLSLGLIDMAWHTTRPEDIRDVSAFENQVIKPAVILPLIDGTNISCSFSHIFAGGYSAGYYSYKWAEVLEADAFELFLEKGLFDRDAAQAFQNYILSRGGSEHPRELYKKFRGREPDTNALLRREGLI